MIHNFIHYFHLATNIVVERKRRSKTVSHLIIKKTRINLYKKLYSLEAEKVKLEEQRIINLQKLQDEASEYGLRKAILKDSVQYFESKKKN